jgi:hypothetical protein
MASTAETTANQRTDDAASVASGALHSVIDQGRIVAEQLPSVDDARTAFNAAQDQLDGLSDRGVTAAAGFSAGVTTGLFLAGAPRLILALSVIPLAVTLRSAMGRGIRLSRAAK